MSTEKQKRYDEAYLRMALEWGKLSHCKRKQVGALIVRDNMIISDGYNGTPSGFPNCCEDEKGDTQWYVLHAEANAILKVAKSTQSAKDATLYLTLSPCFPIPIMTLLITKSIKMLNRTGKEDISA